MSYKSTLKNVTFSQLVADTSINARFSSSAPVAGVAVDTYNIDAMEASLADSKCVLHEPLKVEKTEDGKYRILQGFRRYFGLQRFSANPTAPADCKENLKSIRVMVYDDLDANERLSIIHDHGNRQSLSRAEIAASYWKLLYAGFPPAKAILHMYYDLASLTGNSNRLKDLPAEEKARELFITKWLYPSANGFLGQVFSAGQKWMDQLLLSYMEKDNLLPKDKDGNITSRKADWIVTHTRFRDLVKAWKEDNVETKDGPRATLLIQSYVKKDRGGIGGEIIVPKMVSSKVVKDRIENAKSEIERKTLEFIATGIPVMGMAELAENTARLAELDKIAIRNVDRVAENASVNLREMLRHVMHSRPADFESFLARYCPEGTASSTPVEPPAVPAEVTV